MGGFVHWLVEGAMKKLALLVAVTLVPLSLLAAQTEELITEPVTEPVAESPPIEVVEEPPPPPPNGKVAREVAKQAAEVAQQAAAVEEDPDWAVTLERIAGSVISIKIDATRAFDTEWNNSSQATGFVVDAERGLILTNRHVVTSGPVTAWATFLNREEVQLFPVYRDPVHDFGLYRYEPAKLRFIKPKALPLHPDGAQIGREIRVIGNNAGEQLSILAGTIARLDREAPDYGIGKYNDFNTFYLQAASGTSGGSSGSPVIDIRGRVVALNAGGANGAASSFYLPLGRVRRALGLIQQSRPVKRGTLQVVFKYLPFDELRRLGLANGTEMAARAAFPQQTGMLVVSEVLPGSAAEPHLQPGDVLVKVNGRLMTQFEPLEDTLDNSTGGTIDIEIQRGGRPVTAKVAVGDLHAITPDSYIEVGEAIAHNLSYQMARHFNVPVRGVFLANPGYMFGAAGIPRGAVISQFESQPIETLDDFATALSKLAQGERARVRYSTIDDPNGSQLRSVRMDRRWYPSNYCRRDDNIGIWPCKPLPAAPEAVEPTPTTVQLPRFEDARLNRIGSSLVRVAFDMPYSISGITERNYYGTGLLVDAERGLVVVDRNTVPVALGDVRLTFANTLELPGRVVYVHPLHNLAVVQYDPRLIGATAMKSARLDPRPLKTGDAVWAVGFAADGMLRSRSTEIADSTALQLPLSRTMRFRESNLEVMQLLNPPTDFDGVLLDKSSRVVGLWSSFSFENGRELLQDNRGVAIELVMEMLERVQTDRPLYSLEVEFNPMTLAEARDLGLSEAWLSRLAEHTPTQREILAVARAVGGSGAAQALRAGDLLLAIEGQVVTRFREVERIVADKDIVRVNIWRGDAEQTIEVRTALLSGLDIDRVVQWAGATLQAPHRAMSAQRGIAPRGVYVGFFAYGSPATRYGLYPGQRIVEVDGVPTMDLDAFLAAVKDRPDRASVRLRTITWNNASEVITLKLDQHYWPAYELRRHEQGWERRTLQ
jgi:pro-apoptotic serine protease NMA111